MQRRTAAGYLPFVHHRHNLIECQVTLLLDERDNFLSVVVQWRTASAAGLGFTPALVAPSLMPSHCRTDADLEAVGDFTPRPSLIDRLNDANAQIR